MPYKSYDFYSQEMRKYGRYSHLMRKYCNVQKIKFFQKPIDNAFAKW